MEITCRVYRPRKPRDSPLFHLVEGQLEEMLRLWTDRFARSHGPLRPVVERVLREFLKCGLLELGLSSPEAEKPPPPMPQILRVAEHGDGWGTPEQWDSA